MVKLFLLLFCLVTFSLHGIEDIKVASEIDQRAIAPLQPIQGTLTIRHLKQQKLAPNAFFYDGKPLSVEKIKTVQIDPQDPIVLSIFRFTLPGLPAGIHLLKPIVVTIEGNDYRSLASTFEIKPLQTPTTKQIPFLKLETIIDGNLPLHPGQTIRLGYRFLFNEAIDLTHEDLPLLSSDQLKPIGEPTVNDEIRGGIHIHEVTQVYEVREPGTIDFGPGSVEGNAYIINFQGEKTYLQPTLKVKTPPVTLTVEPFPKAKEPPGFSGAIGQFTLQVDLITSERVTVGEKLTLQVLLQGKGEWNTVTLPPLCCQPGFSGRFKDSDWMQDPERTESQKSFRIDLWPLSSTIKAIPPLTFSFYDSEKKIFQVVQSQPIPLQVLPPKTPPSTRFVASPFPPSPPIKASEKELNQKLRLYSKEASHRPTATIYAKIASSYEQLGALPVALLYYAKARHLNPMDASLKEQLDRVANAMKVSLPTTPFPLSPEAQWYLLMLLAIFSALGASLWIWRRSYQAKLGTYLCLFIFILTWLTIGYQRYFSPIEAVILQPTNLYQSPDAAHTVATDPLNPGLTVRVLAEEQDWIKVLTPEGVLGYVPIDALGII